MKKKLAAIILTLALAAGVMAPVPAYADGITVEETSMDTATEKAFDTDYTVKWDADKVYWNKVTLDQQGILRIHLNEEDPKSLENYDVAVYTAKGKKIWKIMMDCAGAAADNYVGLAKGTYYVSLQSHYQFQGAKKVSVYDQKTSVTIKYLTSKKKYYVRVRSCAKTENDNNKKAYSAWSKVKTVTVK